MVKRIKKGFEVNDDTLGLNAIKEAGPGGHFLDKDLRKFIENLTN